MEFTFTSKFHEKSRDYMRLSAVLPKEININNINNGEYVVLSNSLSNIINRLNFSIIINKYIQLCC